MWLWFGAGAVVLISSGVALLSFFQLERLRGRLKTLEMQLASASQWAERAREQGQELQLIREKHDAAIRAEAAAEAEKQTLREQLQQVREEKNTLLTLKDQAEEAKLQAEKARAIAQEQIQEITRRMQDWEAHREQFAQMARASVLEAGQIMSSKLLEDHKREVETARKQQEETTKLTTSTLTEQFQSLAQLVASLKDQTAESKDKMAKVWHALASPAGAGQLAEVGLENSLKNLGLEAGRDFIMQYAIAQDGDRGALRPDALLFLPQDTVMVIDCKASQFLLHLAEAEGTDREAEVEQQLLATMHQHVSDLVRKDYTSAVMKALEKQQKRVRMLLNVMYLPSDSAIARLKRRDPGFAQKIERAGLILAGPASLAGLLTLAQIQITMARQADNQETIIRATEQLLESMITSLGYVDKLGKGIKQAGDQFVAFAGSLNSRVLPKIRQLSGLGMKLGKHKTAPQPIASYDIHPRHDSLLIEGESETQEESTVTPLLKKMEHG